MKKLILIILILIACQTTKPSGLRLINFETDYSFSPIDEAKGYIISVFRLGDWVSVDNSNWLDVNIPDTLTLSFNQPAFRTDGQVSPWFYEHSDSAEYFIENDPSLYKYIGAGNDTSVFLDFQIEGLYLGNWELSVQCADLEYNTSQYSEPFRFKVTNVIVPLAPVDVLLKLR